MAVVCVCERTAIGGFVGCVGAVRNAIAQLTDIDTLLSGRTEPPVRPAVGDDVT